MAYRNTRRGKPQLVRWDFPRCACRAVVYGGAAVRGTFWGLRLDLDPRSDIASPVLRDLLFELLPLYLRSVGQLL